MHHNKLWKILKEMRIPDHLICLRESCIQVNKQQLKLDMEQWTGSKLGKEYVKAVYCHPAYLTYMQSTSGEGNGNRSSTLACKIPWMGEPGGLQSMGSHRVRHDWSDLAATAEYIMWNAGLGEAQVESRLLGEISITSDMEMTPSLWQKVKKS